MPTPGAPASSSRGRGGKFKKYTRGGGRNFSRDLHPADKVSMWSTDAPNSDQDDDIEEDSDEDSSDDNGVGPASAAAGGAEASREDRKAQKKAKKQAAIAKSQGRNVEVGDMPSSDDGSDDDDDDAAAAMPANPNHSRAARKQTAVVSRGVDEVTEGVAKMGAAPGNRKEREALEAQAAKERYLKLQAEGKTDQAKADLARLKIIREQRAAEAERRMAEKEEKDAQDNARKAEIEAREKKLREAAAAPKKGKKK